MEFLKGNQNNSTFLTCSVIIFCLLGYVFCSGREGLKQKCRKTKQTAKNLGQATGSWHIRSEIFRMCSVKIYGTGCIIILYLKAKLGVKKVDFGVLTQQTGSYIVFLLSCWENESIIGNFAIHREIRNVLYLHNRNLRVGNEKNADIQTSSET